MDAKLSSICVFALLAKVVNGLVSGSQVGEGLGVKSKTPPTIKNSLNSKGI